MWTMLSPDWTKKLTSSVTINLRSWGFNSPQLREKAEQDQTADTSTVVNILGLRWHPVQDTLYLVPKEMVPRSSQPTFKRDVLASRTYDPLGLISPVTVKAKLSFKETGMGRATTHRTGNQVGRPSKRHPRS